MSPKVILFAFISVIYFWDYSIGGPTITPQTFDVDKEAETMRKAVKTFWGTDETSINKVLCTKPYFQRAEIAKKYADKYDGEVLAQRLEKETSGELQKLYRRVMEPRGALLGYDLIDYIKDKNKDRIAEILCATNADEKADLNNFFLSSEYKSNVIDYVKNNVEVDEESFAVLKNQCFGPYHYDKVMNDNKAEQVARQLKSIVDGKMFISAMQKLYSTTSIPDLQSIFIRYRNISNKGVDDTINQILGNNDSRLFWSILIRSTENRSQFYADVLQNAMNGAGTTEKPVYRIILQCCENDLGDIASAYQNMADKKTLIKRVEEDFRGKHEECLYLLLGGKMEDDD